SKDSEVSDYSKPKKKPSAYFKHVDLITKFCFDKRIRCMADHDGHLRSFDLYPRSTVCPWRPQTNQRYSQASIHADRFQSYSLKQMVFGKLLTLVSPGMALSRASGGFARLEAARLESFESSGPLSRAARLEQAPCSTRSRLREIFDKYRLYNH